MSWLSDAEEDNEPLDDDDMAPSDQLSDLMDDVMSESDDIMSEEELDDMYDPTDLDDFG